MKFSVFANNVRKWAAERGIYEHSTSCAQLFKAVSELGETCDAHIKKDYAATKDGVGDVLVCLVNYCEMQRIDIEEAMEAAWNEIKDRKGRMVPGGAFVKDDPS